MAYLSVIDVTDGADVDVRLAALKDGGISSHELLLAPGVEGALDGVGIDSQCARRAQELGSERRHDETRTRRTEKGKTRQALKRRDGRRGVMDGRCARRNLSLKPEAHTLLVPTKLSLPRLRRWRPCGVPEPTRLCFAIEPRVPIEISRPEDFRHTHWHGGFTGTTFPTVPAAVFFGLLSRGLCIHTDEARVA